VRVVGEQEQRLASGGGGQQVGDRQGHQEPVRDVTGALAERRQESIALRKGEVADAVA